MKWLLRQARPGDLPDLLRLAKRLDSINLPHDEKVLMELIQGSLQSFASRQSGWYFGQYLFVLENERGRVVGSSQVRDKHGIVNRPFICFRIVLVKKSSRTIERDFTHTCLKLEWSPEGITEIGGLILDPKYRDHPDRLGKLLSYSRFLYMAMHADKFRQEVMAELLPPLDKRGNSVFWDHVGKKFTGLEYKEANARCRSNAEFMFSLFPHTLIYTNLLPPHIQKLIGAVHPDTEPVRGMLERIGFRFSEEICPFDGGPIYRAAVKDITLIQKTRGMTIRSGKPDAEAVRAIVGFDEAGEFRAGFADAQISDPHVGLDAKALKRLGVRPGQRAYVLPI
ncbi:arginine N-succinyltransferase [bacterium]|nr:arginine N-succinyltransferase [bacterium]